MFTRCAVAAVAGLILATTAAADKPAALQAQARMDEGTGVGEYRDAHEQDGGLLFCPLLGE